MGEGVAAIVFGVLLLLVGNRVIGPRRRTTIPDPRQEKAERVYRLCGLVLILCGSVLMVNGWPAHR